MDREAWHAVIHGVAKSQIRLSDFTFTFKHMFSSVQFCHSVMSNSLRPMNCSMPGLPVHHKLLIANIRLKLKKVGKTTKAIQVSVQFNSVTQSCPTLCDPTNRSIPGLPVHHQLPEFTETHVHRVSDAIQPSHPLFSLLLLPPIPPSIRVFSNESTLHMRWPKYWSFCFSIIPSKEICGGFILIFGKTNTVM